MSRRRPRTLMDLDRARRARRGVLLAVLAGLLSMLVLPAGARQAGVGANPTAWTPSVRGALGTVRTWLQGPPTVGLQVGHWRAREHPEELAALRTSTGGHAAGVDEVTVNAAVADALARRLRAAGVRVEILPATLPPRYRADVLLSLHADAHHGAGRRGYKSAHFRPARNAREPTLKRSVDAAYLRASGLPSDTANVSGAMNRYYAFHFRRYQHAAHPATAALIVEMGYLTDPRDRAWLLQPEGPAAALAEGVLAHLRDRGRWRPEQATTSYPGNEAPGGA